MTTSRCMLREAIGGTGLQGDERLIRFIGHPCELKALLAGGLSLTQARCFPDILEAKGTEADDRWIFDFFGSQADLMRREREMGDVGENATSRVGQDRWSRPFE